VKAARVAEVAQAKAAKAVENALLANAETPSTAHSQ
jgi:hypothetical protein